MSVKKIPADFDLCILVCILIWGDEMPNKTIYVAEDDLPLFERAQQLAGGNLSSAVARALRRFIEVETAHQAGYEEITVPVGPPGSRRQKRFFGVRLIRWQHHLADRGRVEVFSIYRTRGGHYAVHRQERPNWAAWGDPEFWAEFWSNPDHWHGGQRFGMPHRGWHQGGAASLSVYDTLEQLRAEVPPELFEQLETTEEEPPIEDLNI